MKNFKIIKLFIFLITLFLNSCIEIGDIENIGDGFRFGYFDNNKMTSNLYYNDAGIFSGICDEIKWNENYILATVTNTKSQEKNYYLLTKKLYVEQPMQMESKAVVGPISFDSLQFFLDSAKVGVLNYIKKVK
jgi:hypothetical protein